MAPTTRSSSLTLDASWLLVAKTLSFIVSLALPLFLVRHLSQEEFGLYKQAFLIVNSAVVMAPLGFGLSALYFLPREPERRNPIVLNVLLFNLTVGGLACAIFVTQPELVEWIFRGPQLARYATTLGVLVLLWTAASSFEFVAMANSEMKAAGAIIVLIQLTRTGFVLAGAVAFGTVRALLLAAIVQGIGQLIGFVLYVKSRFPKFWLDFELTTMRRQLSYALPLGAAGLLYTAQIDLHNYVVSNRFGPALFAVYAIGTAQLPMVNMWWEAANSVLIPRVSLLQRQGEYREIIGVLARAMRKLAAVYLPMYALLVIVGRELIRFLFTDRYLSSWPIFLVNLTLLPLGIVLMDPLFRAFADQRYYLIRLRIVLVVSLVALLWIGTTRMGLIGAIWAVVAVNAAERAITGVRFGRILGVRWKDLALVTDIGKLALASAAAGLIAALIRSQILWARPFFILAVCGTAFAATYGACVLLLRIPSAEEKRMVLDRIMPMVPAFARARRSTH